MNIEPKEIELKVDSGLTLSGLSWGDESLPKILALHGWLDNAATYCTIAPALAEQFHIVALDFAGHGKSDHRPEGVRYHLIDNVDEVFQFSQALGWDAFHLMGHSMGAGVSTYFTSAFPEKVQSLILIEGLGTHSTEPADAPKTLKKAVKDMMRAPSIQMPLYQGLADAVKARTSVIGSISEQAAQILCERGLKNIEGGVTWSSDPRLKMSSAIRLTEPLVEAFISEIQGDVLFVGGEQGFYGRFPALERRLSLMPHAQKINLPGNHHLHLEPDTGSAVAEAILNFLNG